MSTSLQQLQEWMDSNESEHLEFKEAKNRFDFEELVKYCVALANEGGGKMILGVKDKRPRRVVGSMAFESLGRTKAGIMDRIRLRIDADEVLHPDGRVTVFHVPSRPVGMPIQYKGAYWMRSDENLVPMTPDLLQRIFAETGQDYSAEICPAVTVDDLDPRAIHEFRKRWSIQSKNDALLLLPVDQLLADAELVQTNGVTYAALVLLGKPASLGRVLAQSEVIFEYRSSESAGPASQRIEFREGFLLFYDRLWETINLRNDVQHYQDGLFMVDIPTFSEGSVREAILNAVSHRDYRLAGSVFIRQYQRRIEIVSPGGFPAGITAQNIIHRQSPRNRRIAEAFEKCDLVERSGQGANRMFEESIRQSKPLPDFTGTDAYQVSVILRGDVQDPQFLRFLEKVGQERLRAFRTEDLLVLDLVHRGEPVPETLKPHLDMLVEQGLVETIGRGKQLRCMLSRQFHAFLGKPGVYTRKRGLDHETNKALLVKHIRENSSTGSRLNELMQVLPALSRRQVQELAAELREEQRVHHRGRGIASRWYPGPDPEKNKAIARKSSKPVQ
jgi:ATP-dependent DNA helicase RecG